jgi:hypothetical protein
MQHRPPETDPVLNRHVCKGRQGSYRDKTEQFGSNKYIRKNSFQQSFLYCCRELCCAFRDYVTETGRKLEILYGYPDCEGGR